ncbi:hypothetical protein TVAG_265510 [Trichomonas vaginalis G3]|uniref:CWH43-like N-terminal domain-containing protein n=1 Tax=Trichomonas vaginalis (strain ATCC PRA-98 / G3) TaxID=412133 RepID=A2FGB6_TRIV3|nr:Frag1/DRAM/Sfk1 family [Trichomonas vaginalis G3]EAX96062.1 hypothetical protein TVAG_265510 [Trichomonas vaginalis G3]KAI5504006.1 Frag1/DRAM/Sfk1 family [Trichomonas vaginalis G3]|eukprot:XP_001308992.1 hypothetical protein [Trichomonas vaginalis G3]
MAAIKHKLTFLYYFGSIFPFTIVIISWICYYSLGHYTKGKIPYISDTVVKLPQRRIFAAGMSIEGWFIILIFYLRISYCSELAHEANVYLTISYKIKVFILWILLVCAPIGLFVLSAITLEMNLSVHLTGAAVFFFGSFIFYAVSDFTLMQCKVKLNIISLVLTWLVVGFLVLYTVFASFSKRSFVNAGAIFQYISSLCIFGKLFCMQYDIPGHHIEIKRE